MIYFDPQRSKKNVLQFTVVTHLYQNQHYYVSSEKDLLSAFSGMYRKKNNTQNQILFAKSSKYQSLTRTLSDKTKQLNKAAININMVLYAIHAIESKYIEFKFKLNTFRILQIFGLNFQTPCICILFNQSTPCELCLTKENTY